MAQQKRVALTMPAELDRVFDRLAELEGKPKTKIIIDYLESILPHAESMLTAMEALKEKKQHPALVIQNLTAQMLQSMGQLGSEMSIALEEANNKQVDWVNQK